MNTDERESIESVSADENTLDAERPIVGRRGYTLGILIAALAVAELLKDVAFSTDLAHWLPAWEFLYYGAMACLPFLLARMAPKVAGFDTQWLPSSRWQWAWFLGMIFLLIVAKVLVAALAATIVGHLPPRPSFGPVTPIGIVFLGITIVFIAPIAEEIFFRGYVLEQMRKLTRSWIALLIQALLFSVFHLYTWGLFTSLALFNSVDALFFGLIVGAWRIKFRSLLPLVLAHVLVNSTVIVSLKARYDQAVYRSHPQYTISKETTYITEPLRTDGFVDYVAALNQRFSQGVTPENNAAVLFWQAVGPKEILPEYRDKYFQMLGIPPLPEKGDYFLDYDHYTARQKNDTKPADAKPEAGAQDNTSEQLDLATTRPWSQQTFPVLAEWLAANQKPLALVVEASKRPRRYDPLVCGEKVPLIAVPVPAGHCYRKVARALCARAMLRLNDGKLEEAWADLLTCHRLARLAGQGPTMIEAMQIQSVDGRACDGDQALLQYGYLTAAQAAKMQEDLARLPAMPKMADMLDVAERFSFLNIVSDFSREGPASLAGLDEVAEKEAINGSKQLRSTVKSLAHYSDSTAIDWDLILRMGNSWIDRIVDAYHKPTRAAQKEAMRKLSEDFRMLKSAAENTGSLDKAMLGDPRQALSERVGQLILIMFSPSITMAADFDDRATMTFELTQLAFALAAYRVDHGAYPAKLADLTPKYVAELPKDVFNDSELHYRLEGAGYVLYSVGSNGRDDGGKGFENGRRGDGFMEKDWDDIVVRVPAPAEK